MNPKNSKFNLFNDLNLQGSIADAIYKVNDEFFLNVTTLKGKDTFIKEIKNESKSLSSNLQSQNISVLDDQTIVQKIKFESNI